MAKKQNKYNTPPTYAPLVATELHKDFIKCLGGSDEILKILYEENCHDKDPYLINAVDKTTGELRKRFAENGVDLKSADEQLGFASLLNRWQTCKQVFKFDDTFIRHFSNTDNIVHIKNLWNYLPFRTFYMDFSNCSSIKELDDRNDSILHKLEGVFVSVDENSSDNNYIVYFAFLSKDKHYTMSTTCVDNEDFEKPFKEIKDINITDGKVTVLFFQLLNYLSSSKADIIMDVETEMNYKPRPEGTKPRNHISEVQKWDVGYRLGAEFRRWDNEMSKQSAKGTGMGSPKRPHYRRGHQHTYWYGKRNSPDRHRELVWVEPMPVGMKYSIEVDKLNELPATIRNVIPEPPSSNKKDDYGKE